MADSLKLSHPWMVAIWPGMGHVALNAGVYLLAKLNMGLVAEFASSELFDVDFVEVKDGLVQPARRPRNRLFAWKDPRGKHDVLLFLGEAQPPIGKYSFCRQLVEFAKKHGVERIFTFAAMATAMHPEHSSRVFFAATDEVNLQELQRMDLSTLEDGNIGGLNGIILAAAAEEKVNGVCLLGEMPHIFTHMPYPRASLAILEVFTEVASIDLDFGELAEMARAADEHLGELLAQAEEQLGQSFPTADEALTSKPVKEAMLSEDERKRIDQMFNVANQDRSKAFELKQELDRLGVFKEYEDRFLDLFKKPSAD